MKNLVVIDNSVVRMMIADARYLELLPCLADAAKVLQAQKPKCGSCGREKNPVRDALADAKSCLASLPGTKKSALKQLLGTKRVRIVHVKSGGKTVQITY